MAKYTINNIEIQAVQLRWNTWGELCETFPGVINAKNSARISFVYSDDCGESPPFMEIDIPVLSGKMLVKHGDFVFKTKSGQHYACPPYIFKKLID